MPPVDCSKIMRQVNNSDFKLNIFTDKIGTENGVKGRSCCFCFTRFWAWRKNARYDKNAVTEAINNAFRGVQLRSLDKSSLTTFKGRLEQLEAKFNKKGTLRTDLQETITKIDNFLNPPSKSKRKARTRTTGSRHSQRSAPQTPPVRRTAANPSRVNPKEHVHVSASAASTARVHKSPAHAKPSAVKHSAPLDPIAQRSENESMLMTIAAEEGTQFGEAAQTYYGPDSEFVPVIMQWSTEIYEEILKKYSDSLSQPIDQKEVREQFQSLMKNRIVGYNMEKVELEIPHLFADSTSGVEKKAKWLPDFEAEAQLGEFMSVLPFSQSVIQHIKKMIQEATVSVRTQQLKKQTSREVLGLPRKEQLTTATINRAYRKLALRHHPDKNMGKTALELALTEETFKRITQAHTKLLERAEKAGL